ncbi:MAG TPA: prepilin-type N-terminal cleavage/methylation domain-containing protein [Smithella sp.]|nr:prepilin-type N-terminal cleavage/methylation domain-containing protein [Smithella sp.]
MKTGMRLETRASRGFTLVEVLIAVFILSIVLTTVYVSYSQTLRTARQMEEESALYGMARVAMDRLIKDLTSLQPSEGSFYFSAEKKKLGTRDFAHLSLWSAGHLALSETDTTGRPAMITYYAAEQNDQQGFSLFRADVFGAKPQAEEKSAPGFVICKNVDAFRLTFYDEAGIETDSWNASGAPGDSKRSLPAAVKIELFLVNPQDAKNPFKFMTKVFLPAAQKL